MNKFKINDKITVKKEFIRPHENITNKDIGTIFHISEDGMHEDDIIYIRFPHHQGTFSYYHWKLTLKTKKKHQVFNI